MAITELDLQAAEKRMKSKSATHAVDARYDRARGLVFVALNSGVQIGFPPAMAQGLSNATTAQLGNIEITPTGLGLHWPMLDADLYVPNLLRGILGSSQWMAAKLGAEGGRVRSTAKAASARANGLKGGRPRKTA
ncbi:MAG: DUF2442 domain-containing protein [Rhodanobacter sp.]